MKEKRRKKTTTLEYYIKSCFINQQDVFNKNSQQNNKYIYAAGDRYNETKYVFLLSLLHTKDINFFKQENLT